MARSGCNQHTGPQIPAEQFIKAWHEEGGSPTRVARALRCTVRNVYYRRDALEAEGHLLATTSDNPAYLRPSWTYPKFVDLELRGGSALIGSDRHAWPGPAPPAWRAFVEVANKAQPAVIVLNGDMIDGARVSRHEALRRSNPPRIETELETLQREVLDLPPARRIHTIGNHDMRVDAYIARQAQEAEGLCRCVADYLPDWEFCYAALINEGAVGGMTEVRHRYRGGEHAGKNNAKATGITTVTGHTHQLDATPIYSRLGVHYGIEDGMLADPEHACFEYTEGNPTRWQAGFVLLTWDEHGLLLPPEICRDVRGRMMFRGEVVVGRQYVTGASLWPEPDMQ